jgi:hypothetical protein
MRRQLPMVLGLIGLGLLAACVALPPQEKPTPAPGGETATPMGTFPKGDLSPTATPAASSTPAPAGAALPTPPATAASIVATLPAGQLPPLAHDVLLVDHGRLLLFDHSAGAVVVLAGPLEPGEENAPGYVLAFSADAAVRRVAFVRVPFATPSPTPTPLPYPPPPVPGPIEPDGELVLLDVATRQITVMAPFPIINGAWLGPDTAWVRLALSPDGEWLALSVPAPAGRGQAGLAAPAARGGPLSVAIDLLRVGAPEQRVHVAGVTELQPGKLPYGGDGPGLLWSPDSRTLAWSDQNGVWIGGLDVSARQVVTNVAADENDDARGTHLLRAWSPSGRYLLTTITFMSGTNHLGVIDSVAGRAVQVDAPYNVRPWNLPHATWLRGGAGERLFVTYVDDHMSGAAPVGEICRLDPSDARLLVCDAAFALPVEPAGAGAGASVLALGQLADERLVYAIAGSSAASGLYAFDPAGGALLKLNNLPPDIPIVDVIWAPDDRAALAYAWDGSRTWLLYMPGDGGPWFDLTSLATDVRWPQWAP